MKKKVITMAMFALLGILATGCQKENINPETVTATDTACRYMVKYSVDGVHNQAQFQTEEEQRAFLHSLMALAREGHVVCLFGNDTSSASLTKETVVYRTPDETNALTWADKMRNDGYTVTITFDEDKEEFVCIAIK
ncbi:MAG: hypothetical protein J6Y52_00060 [Bacteroidales bacterium]|nr:hypothetical protein [Bacteroidales bacterium]